MLFVAMAHYMKRKMRVSVEGVWKEGKFNTLANERIGRPVHRGVNTDRLVGMITVGSDVADSEFFWHWNVLR